MRDEFHLTGADTKRTPYPLNVGAWTSPDDGRADLGQWSTWKVQVTGFCDWLCCCVNEQALASSGVCRL